MPERLEPNHHDTWRQFGHQHLQRYMFAQARIEGSRVLDLACGVGYGSYILAQERGRDVTGLDLDPSAILYGQANYQRTGLRLLAGDALSWRNDGAPFDTIVSFETIEHLPSPSIFVARLAEMIKADGRLLISAPNTLQHKLAPNPVENEFHLNEPDYDTLCSWLTPYFVIESEWEQSSVLPPGAEQVEWLAREMDKLRSRWWLRACNRIEGGLRRFFGYRPAAPNYSKDFIHSTEIFPLLPERRATCEVFLFSCRRNDAVTPVGS